MLRNDIFCIYKDQEFSFVSLSDEKAEIVTDDIEKIDASFLKYDNTLYYKQVSLSDLSQVYSVNSYGVYDGEIFPIVRSQGDCYELTATDQLTAFTYKMKCTNKNEYAMLVPKDEVEVFEERKEIEL